MTDRRPKLTELEALQFPSSPDPEQHCARRINRGGRVLVLPPGEGKLWGGSAR